MRKTGSQWSVEIEVDVCGPSMLLPDFSLVCHRGRVFVDVVPFATPSCLAKRLDAVRALRAPYLVCVDARFTEGATGASDLFVYRGSIDTNALLEAAAGALARYVSEPSPPAFAGERASPSLRTTSSP